MPRQLQGAVVVVTGASSGIGRGVLINVDSAVAGAPQPYTSAYVASKYAIRGWGECLQMELSLESGHDIHVCTVMPATIDTPLFQQAANYTGRATKAVEPVYPPEAVAAAIVELARRPRSERIVGGAGRMLMLQHAAVPRLYRWAGARHIDREHLDRRPAAPTPGNLFEPMPQYARVSGGWDGREGPAFDRVAATALLGGGIALLSSLAWLASRGRHRAPRGIAARIAAQLRRLPGTRA